MLSVIPAIHACIKTVKNTAIAVALTQKRVRRRFRRMFLQAMVISIKVPPRLYVTFI
jgi:hypothetical protein